MVLMKKYLPNVKSSEIKSIKLGNKKPRNNYIITSHREVIIRNQENVRAYYEIRCVFA